MISVSSCVKYSYLNFPYEFQALKDVGYVVQPSYSGQTGFLDLLTPVDNFGGKVECESLRCRGDEEQHQEFLSVDPHTRPVGVVGRVVGRHEGGAER